MGRFSTTVCYTTLENNRGAGRAALSTGWCTQTGRGGGWAPCSRGSDRFFAEYCSVLFFWFNQPGGKISHLGHYLSAIMTAVVSAAVLAAVNGFQCEDDFDCSLAGTCRAGSCHCKPWAKGLECAELNLIPPASAAAIRPLVGGLASCRRRHTAIPSMLPVPQCCLTGSAAHPTPPSAQSNPTLTIRYSHTPIGPGGEGRRFTTRTPGSTIFSALRWPITVA